MVDYTCDSPEAPEAAAVRSIILHGNTSAWFLA